ncbi:hypothetical protein PQE75_gp094 [Bacillus phage vB_BcoS-136]|uniref:Uncharacterized protein n=1 Tax=Bacillus phage vB_BcoS-136 TaxID=2419619 RepID=A0A3G3BVX8_9CAUD|nr:hypothetical protein PQE75_gp094 [Bacillus phage vB_BcoS-136]AYP68226.1 hypothetical protein vBBcoS136_00094 [Bacillus phage vB_BcoS-136]
MSNTMTFRIGEGNILREVKRNNIIDEMRNTLPLSTAYIVDVPMIKERIKQGSNNKNRLLSVSAPLVIGVASTAVGGGIFWHSFMTYIFPYMLDIAKVFCAIKIAQAFYQERQGGREQGSGMSAMVTYGKWYLLFALMPWVVELFDQLGARMLIDLRTNS